MYFDWFNLQSHQTNSQTQSDIFKFKTPLFFWASPLHGNRSPNYFWHNPKYFQYIQILCYKNVILLKIGNFFYYLSTHRSHRSVVRGSGSREGYVLVNEKGNFLLKMLGWMVWLTWTLLNQWYQCGVNDLYPRATRKNFGALFDFITKSKIMLQLHAFALGSLFWFSSCEFSIIAKLHNSWL